MWGVICLVHLALSSHLCSAKRSGPSHSQTLTKNQHRPLCKCDKRFWDTSRTCRSCLPLSPDVPCKQARAPPLLHPHQESTAPSSHA